MTLNKEQVEAAYYDDVRSYCAEKLPTVEYEEKQFPLYEFQVFADPFRVSARPTPMFMAAMHLEFKDMDNDLEGLDLLTNEDRIKIERAAIDNVMEKMTIGCLVHGLEMQGEAFLIEIQHSDDCECEDKEEDNDDV